MLYEYEWEYCNIVHGWSWYLLNVLSSGDQVRVYMSYYDKIKAKIITLRVMGCCCCCCWSWSWSCFDL